MARLKIAYLGGGSTRGAGTMASFIAVRALVANPLVRSLDVAERLYGEMSVALREHLPDRLVAA